MRSTAESPHQAAQHLRQARTPAVELIQLQPNDEHNQQLESNVRPPDWATTSSAHRFRSS
jgi:hypothetical protein